MVWHWIPFLGSAAGYGRDPIGFFRECREKVCLLVVLFAQSRVTCEQYGNCFTFILLGSRVTVTLGTQGNDYVFGGKHTQLAAEDVYSVRSAYALGCLEILFHGYHLALDYAHFRQGCRV